MYASLVVAIKYVGLSIQITLRQKNEKLINATYWIKAALSLLCVKKEGTFKNRSYGDMALRGGPPTIYSNAQFYNNNSATCDVITTSLTYGGDK